MVPLTQGSERSLGPWQTYKVVFAASIKMQLCMDVMHGRQHWSGLLLSTLYSVRAGLPCAEAVTRPLEARILVFTPLFADTPSYGGAHGAAVWRVDWWVEGNCVSVFPADRYPAPELTLHLPGI